jgi:hypothetical protein
MQIVATAIFALAILHTFSTKFFERLAHSRPAHSGVWHLLAEVEIVFGFWALVMAAVMFSLQGTDATKTYVNGRNFTEPMFVFVIMVVAGTRPRAAYGKADRAGFCAPAAAARERRDIFRHFDFSATARFVHH